jgi:hypothetical protein
MPESEERTRAVIVLVMDGSEHRVGTIALDRPCDFDLVDAILRLQLAASALGWSIRLRDVHPRLRELVDLVGCGDRLGL